MRVSDAQRYRAFTGDLQQRLVNLHRIEREIGTGRSLFAPSENIRRADQALRSDAALSADKQSMRNIEDGQIWIRSADGELQSVLDLINAVETLALAANNDAQNPEDRTNTAIQINQKLEELLGLANAANGNRYLFGGHNTTSGPFIAQRDADGKITGATANAETLAGRIYRRIGQDEDVQINIPGTDLFQPAGSAGADGDLFHVIAVLRNTIANNNVPPEGFEESQSNEHLRGQLALIRERVADQQSYLGSVGQRLEAGLTRLREREIQLTDSLEQAQGAELTELVSRLASEEGAYNALAAISTRLLRLSLIDYLR